MKTRLLIFLGALFIAVQMVAQDFDFTALDSSYVTCTTGSYYSPYLEQGVEPGRHTIITEQGFDSMVPSLPMIPPGATRSMRLGNPGVGAEGEAIIYDVLVTEDKAILVLNYAAVMQNSDHIPTRQPRFMLDILDSEAIRVCKFSTELMAYSFKIKDILKKLSATRNLWVKLNGITKEQAAELDKKCDEARDKAVKDFEAHLKEVIDG
jgi:hypothetical protein